MIIATLPQGLKLDYVPWPSRFPATSIDNEDLASRYLSGATLGTLAAHFGCSIHAIRRRARHLGLPPRLVSSGKRPQARIAALYDAGHSCREIGSIVGAHESVVLAIARRRGCKIRPPKVRGPDLRAECVRLWRQGVTDGAIGKCLGMSINQVRKRIRKVLGGPRKRGLPPKVTTEAVVAAVNRYRGCETWREIGARLGVHAETVRHRYQKWQKENGGG